MKYSKILRTLTIAFILSLLLVVMPSTPALAAPAIAVSPTSGAVGTVVTVTGTNFDSYKGDDIFLFFNSREITTSPLVVPQTGSFSLNFYIPDSDPGGHWIRVKSELGSTLAKGLFTILETEIGLDTRVGTVGTKVTIGGRGFYADKMVTFYYDNGTKEKLGTEVATTTGEFSYSFIVPAGTAGKHKITAENAEGNSAEAEFKVVPSTTLTPISGAVGDILTVSGTGFAYRSDVAIYFKDTEVAYARTNQYGNFQVAFNVPAMIADAYDVKTEDGDGNTDKAGFTIATGARLDKTLGNVGTELTVSGTGFIAGGTVNLKYDDMSIGAITADSNGAFRVSFEVPVSKYGNHVITVSDGVNTKQLAFAVEWEAPLIPMLLLPDTDSEAKAEAYFDWEDVTDPSLPITYSFQVAADKNFTSIVLEKKWLTDSEYTLTKEERLAAVEKEVPYYWRVKAMDSATNESEWSTPWSFYVMAPSALPGWAIYILIGLAVLLVGFIAFLVGRRTAYSEPS